VSAYADTSFLLSYFGQDAKTPLAHNYAAGWTEPPRIAWTAFGELEFRNAARGFVFSGKLDLAGLAAIEARVREDLRGDILTRRTLSADSHYRTAETISATHTIRLGVRTLDLLHVAAAQTLEAREFLSFDGRQREFALRCGLQVLP
jgi:predicted nucleic acid-binding protein